MTDKTIENVVAGTKVSYTTKPKYEQVTLLGKTIESAGFAGTADREKMKRAYITENAGFDGSQMIVKGTDEYGIRTVKAVEVVAGVKFVGAENRIPATWKLRGYAAKSVENEGAIDVFVGEEMGDKVAALLRTADAVSAQSPEFAGLWYTIDAETGTRIFIRAFSPVDAHGNVIG